MTECKDNVTNKPRHHYLFLAAICLLTLIVRYCGTEWPSLHPDEVTIASWVDYRKDHAHIEERFYGEGFFVLIKPVYAAHLWLKEQKFRWKCFQRAENVRPVIEREILLFCREFNIWLAVINVVILYFLITVITKSSWAGLLGALWLALTPIHIEHSHYAETDIAAMMMLSLSLLIWTRVIIKGGLFLFLLAAVVTGFTIGTKFTMLALLFCALAVCWSPLGCKTRPALWTVLSRSIGILLLCVIGVIMANPGILAWSWFYPKMQTAYWSVYSERSGLFNGVTDRLFPMLVNWKHFRGEFVALGLPFAGLIVFGAFSSFRARFRVLWPVTIVFPVVFFIYYVFLAPWVRCQEFMLFFTSFTIWAGIGLISLAEALATLSERMILRNGVIALVVMLVVLDVSVVGMQRVSCFRYADPRTIAQEWLIIHAPPDRVTGCGDYTNPAFKESHGKMIEIRSVERESITNVCRKSGVEYVVRNPLARGRGTVNPLTDVRFAEFDSNWDDFIKAAQPIWKIDSIVPIKGNFAYMPIEYCGLIHSSPSISMSMPLFQPGRVSDLPDESIWTFPVSIGSVKMVEIDRNPRNLVVAGQGDGGRPVYVILQTLDRGASVRVKGLGQSRNVQLMPHSVEVLTLERPFYVPNFDIYEVIEVRAEREKHMLRIPCYAEALLDESSVISRLIQKGYPDKALALLRSRTGILTSPKMILPAFSVASSQGDWTIAGRLREQAEMLLQKLRQAETNRPELVECCGVNGVYYNDTARVRMDPVSINLNCINDPEIPKPAEIVKDELLPVRIARGDYQLSFSLAFNSFDPSGSNAVPVTVNVTGAKSQVLQVVPGSERQVEVAIHVERETDLYVVFKTPCSGMVEMNYIELRWKLADMLRAASLELSRSLCRHDLYRLPASAALTSITEKAAEYPDDLELSRLKVAALTLAEKGASDEAASTLRKIQEKAPDYNADVTHGADCELPVSNEFYPFFRMAGVKHDASGRTLVCRFVVLRDEAPTPVVTLWERRKWPVGWRKKKDCSPCSRPVLFKGEQFQVEIPLPDRSVKPFKGLALSVRSNVKFLPYDYKVSGQSETKLYLDSWFKSK